MSQDDSLAVRQRGTGASPKQPHSTGKPRSDGRNQRQQERPPVAVNPQKGRRREPAGQRDEQQPP